MSFKRIVIVILICAAIGLYMWDALLIFHPSAGTDKKATAFLQKVGNASAVAFLVPGKVQFKESGRSPFLAYASDALPAAPRKAIAKQGPATEAIKLPPMSINGIMWSNANPIAVIAFGDGSSTLAKKGDVLPNGVTVLIVQQNRVEFVFQGKKFWIEK
jgi:hypothetical protein